MAIVWVGATTGYMRAGWNFQDSFYMVTLTVFTVGYDEVRPIDTRIPALADHGDDGVRLRRV